MKLLMESIRPVLRALLLRFWLMERIEAIEKNLEDLSKLTKVLQATISSIPCRQKKLDMDCDMQ